MLAGGNVGLMKCRLLILTGCLFWLAFAASPCVAKQWRNVAPMRTTRAEVLQLLGNPKQNQSDNGEYFDLATETVTFKWVHPTCGTQNPIVDESSIQPDDLVLNIAVKPKVPIQSKDLDISRPKSYSDWLSEDVDCLGNGEDGVWNCTIINGREGFGYATSKDGVVAIYYFPTDEEARAWNSEHKSCQP
jgi:hypothetical protein